LRRRISLKTHKPMPRLKWFKKKNTGFRDVKVFWGAAGVPVKRGGPV